MSCTFGVSSRLCIWIQGNLRLGYTASAPGSLANPSLHSVVAFVTSQVASFVNVPDVTMSHFSFSRPKKLQFVPKRNNFAILCTYNNPFIVLPPLSLSPTHTRADALARVPADRHFGCPLSVVRNHVHTSVCHFVIRPDSLFF